VKKESVKTCTFSIKLADCKSVSKLKSCKHNYASLTQSDPVDCTRPTHVQLLSHAAHWMQKVRHTSVSRLQFILVSQIKSNPIQYASVQHISMSLTRQIHGAVNAAHKAV